MVGYLKSTERMFEVNGYTGTESHVGIGGKWGTDAAAGLDGVAWQFQDDNHTADANYEGSWHILSIETADNAPQHPEDIEPWTPKQVDKLVEVIVEWCLLYDIPPVLIPDTKPGRRGLAYHYQGVPPNLVRGGELWSKAGHTCPGPVRVKQFIREVIPRVKEGVEGHMPLNKDDLKSIRELIIDVLRTERIIPNLPVVEGEPQSKNWTTTEVQAADDRKLDTIIRMLKEQVKKDET